MAQLRDEYGNPVELTDELGNPVQLRDEHGNLVHIKGVATTGAGTTTTESHLGAPPVGVTERGRREEEGPPYTSATTARQGPLETTHHTLGDALKDTGHATERTAAGALRTTGHATERAAAGTAAVGGGILGGAAGVGGSLVSSVTGNKGTDENRQHHPASEIRRSPSTSSSSSSEDDGQGGRRKKKGLTQKIKDKLTGNKHKDNKDPVTGQEYASSTTTTTTTTANPEHHEKKSVMEKIKEKLPGHHGHGQHNH
ncbi:unnamed protein product [Linum trigynum]|uniref:Dehydrin n=1 Tax=Linum trigynum TaxID=586398 RepID=A0AAV2CB03_9ROSI